MKFHKRKVCPQCAFDYSGYIQLEITLSPQQRKGVFKGQSFGKRLLDIKFVVLALGMGSGVDQGGG